jgi:hypothetical protein
MAPHGGLVSYQNNGLSSAGNLHKDANYLLTCSLIVCYSSLWFRTLAARTGPLTS